MSTAADPRGVALADFAATPSRPPERLWEITGLLCLTSDTHLGAAHPAPRHAAESDVDLLVDRDPTSGVPRLRATTLAGLLRHELAARAGTASAAALFGDAEAPTDLDHGVDPPTRGLLHLDDATAVLPEDAGVAVRVGIRTDPRSGAVASGAMWQQEILPAGTVFRVCLRLHLAPGTDEARPLALLALAADGLTGTGYGIHLGGRSGRGFGAVRADAWHARRHDLAGEDGWFAYYGRTWDQRHTADLDGAPGDLRAVLRAELAAHGGDPAPLAADVADPRRRAELRLTVAVAEPPTPAFLSGGTGTDTAPRPGPLMVGDVPATERLGVVDRAHRHRPTVTDRTPPGKVEWRPVLGDTALFALFKRIGRRLARDLAAHTARDGHSADWRSFHDRWWGADTAHHPGATGRARHDTTALPSAIRLRHTPALSGGETWTTTRLTVDALFGDAVDGRLFTDDPHCGGHTEVVLDVRDPDDAIYGLLTLVVRELATVPFDTLGAGAGIGSGRLTVTAAHLRHQPGTADAADTDLLAALREPDSAERRRAQGWLDALTTALTPRSEPEEAP